MASVGAINYAQLNHITKKYYIPQLIDNIFKSNIVTYRLLAKSQPVSGGYKIVQPIEVAKTVASEGTALHGFYKGDDAMNYGSADIIQSAEYDWKQAYGTVQMSGREENINSGPEAVLDLLQAKMNNLARTMKDTFAKTIYSDNDPETAGTATVSKEAPYGLQHICAEDRILGGINSNTAGNEFWDGGMDVGLNQFTAFDDSASAGGFTGSGGLTTTDGVFNIQKLFRKGYKDLTVGNDSPTMIICNQVVFDAYEATLQAQKRFGASSQTLADAGFQNLLYRGIPVVVDQALEQYTASSSSITKDGNRNMFFINEKYMGYKHHAKRNFVFDGFEKPVDADIRVGKMLWMGALCVSNPRMFGKIASMPTDYTAVDVATS
tara:strand:- start:221 stop:1354 length:1134 start_codon:yes stop_codon:yes gene_type:complete